MTCTIIAMQLKNPRHIILSGVPSGMLWATQYFLLGATMGAIANASSALKNLLSAFVPQHYLPYILGLYLTMIWGIGLYNLSAWYGICPLIGASTPTIALLINRDNRRLYARAVIICCAFWACYNSIVGSWMGLCCDTLTITSSLIGMYRHEQWDIGKCYRTFLPSLYKSLFSNPIPKTYP